MSGEVAAALSPIDTTLGWEMRAVRAAPTSAPMRKRVLGISRKHTLSPNGLTFLFCILLPLGRSITISPNWGGISGGVKAVCRLNSIKNLLPIVVNDSLNCRAGNNIECWGGWHFCFPITPVSELLPLIVSFSSPTRASVDRSVEVSLR